MTTSTPKAPKKSNYEYSRFNATKHGLTSTKAVLPWESSAEYEQFHAEIAAEFSPEGFAETRLVADIADILWRKQRVQKAEMGAFQFALGGAVMDRFVPGQALVAQFEHIPKERLERLEYFMEIFAVEPERAETMKAKVETELAFIATQIRQLRECEESLRDLESSSETIDEDVAAKGEQEEDNPSTGLLRKFTERQTELEYELEFLKIYREVHRAAHYEAAADPAFGNIARHETHLDRTLERALKNLLAIKKLKSCAVTINPD